MRKRLLSSIFIMLAWTVGAVPPAFADVVRVSHTVLLPDGKPAARARILIRTLNVVDGTLKNDLRITADDRGQFTADLDRDRASSAMRVTAYVMIDAHDAALTFVELDELLRRSSHGESALRLSQGNTVSGTVVARGDRPVAGATIIAHEFLDNWGGWRLNHRAAGITTPELITRSGADGTFSVRPVDMIAMTGGSGPPLVRMLLSATGNVDGQVQKASIEEVARPLSGPAPVRPIPPTRLYLQPAISVEGTVTDRATGKPIAGVSVRLVGVPSNVTNTIPSAITDSAGRFAFKEIPSTLKLYLEAKHPGRVKGWMLVRDRAGQFSREQPQPNVYRGVVIALQPLHTVAGKVVDMSTNQPPVAPVSLQAVIGSEHYGHSSPATPDVTVVRTQPDGRFSIQLPPGVTEVRVSGLGYRSDIALLSPNTGAGAMRKDQTIAIRRAEGFLVHFVTKHPNGMKGCSLSLRSLRKPVTEEYVAEWWHWPDVQEWGDTIEIRLMRGEKELLPWTSIKADPVKWPTVIPLNE